MEESSENVNSYTKSNGTKYVYYPDQDFVHTLTDSTSIKHDSIYVSNEATTLTKDNSHTNNECTTITNKDQDYSLPTISDEIAIDILEADDI